MISTLENRGIHPFLLLLALMVASLTSCDKCSFGSSAEDEAAKETNDLIYKQAVQALSEATDNLIIYQDSFQNLIARYKNFNNPINENNETAVSAKKVIIKRIAEIKSIISNQEQSIDELNRKVKLKDDQLAAYKATVRKLEKKIAAFAKENNVLLRDNEILAQEKTKISKRLANTERDYDDLYQKIINDSIRYAAELEQKQAEIDYLNGKKRSNGGGSGGDHSCILILKESYFERAVTGSKIQFTCDIDHDNLLSRHPRDTYIFQGNNLIISHPDRFWQYSKNLIFKTKERSCQFSVKN